MRALSSPHVQSTFRQRAIPPRASAPSPPPLLRRRRCQSSSSARSRSRGTPAPPGLVTAVAVALALGGASPYARRLGAAFASRVPSWHRQRPREDGDVAAAAAAARDALAADAGVGSRDTHRGRHHAAAAHRRRPLPPRRPAVVAALCLAQMAHFYSMCAIFSYAGFLANDSGWVSTPDRAGYVAGLLATMLPLGRLPTSMLWGSTPTPPAVGPRSSARCSASPSATSRLASRARCGRP